MGGWLAATLAALFVTIYLPAAGHGFVKDDFHWIAVSRVHSIGDVVGIFASNTGFYRPLVTLSFALDSAIWGVNPYGFAITNLLLLAVDAAFLVLLARLLALSPAAALFAAATWAFNFHGINVAVLWTSGRTALLLCLFAIASTIAWLRDRRLLAGAFALAAMLSKEEAVVLPPLLFAIDLMTRRDSTIFPKRIRGTLTRLWPLWVALVVYAALRLHSGAFGPWTAPDYYRLTLAPRSLLRNGAEYLDRGATWPIVAAVVVMLIVRPRGPMEASERRVLGVGVLWFMALYAITVLVVVRSSLYAVAPSIGSALVAGTLAGRCWRANPRRFRLAAGALVVMIAAAVPIYRARNSGLVDPADLSTRSLNTLRAAAAGRDRPASIVLIDDPTAPVTLAAAFGALFSDAVHLFVDPEVTGEIVASRDAAPPVDAATVMFELRGGELIQLR